MMAITTSNSISVKPYERMLLRILDMDHLEEEEKGEYLKTSGADCEP